MTAQLLEAVPRRKRTDPKRNDPKGTDPKDGNTDKLRWMAAVAAAILFLILAGLMNGVAYWKLSEEQQHLALALSKKPHRLVRVNHPVQ